MHGDAHPPIVLHQLHARDIGKAVTDVDHIGEGNRTTGLRSEIVQLLVFEHIKHPLIDPEQELGLGSVIDRKLRPYSDTVFIIEILTCIDSLKPGPYRRPFDDLPQTGRDDIVIDGEPEPFPDLIDIPKPRGDSWKELQVRPQGDKILPPYGLATLFGLIKHKFHIGKDAVHLLLLSQGIGLIPEGGGLHAQLGYEGILLHVTGGEGLVKIIHDGDGRFLLHTSKYTLEGLRDKQHLWLTYQLIFGISLPMKHQSIGRLIAILHRKSQIFTNKALKEFSLTSAEYPFLFALYHKEGQTQEELSSYLYIDKAATARVIKSLMAKGFVRKEQNAQDMRCNHIFLTEKAKQERSDIHARVMQWNSYITEGLDEETYQSAFAALQTMVDQVEKKSILEDTGV